MHILYGYEHCVVPNNLYDVFSEFLYSQLLLLPYECHLRFFLFIINTVLLSQFIIIFVVSLLEIVALKEI